MFIVILATIVTISALYAPQPLLPVLAREFGVARSTAAFLTTAVFIPVSLAPLIYGYILQSVSPRRMLRLCMALLACTEFLFAAATSFPALMVLRLVQGLLVPAMLTALMTYVSKVSTDATVQRRMAIYIAATILGGFLGRFLSGALTSLVSWRFSFALLAATTLGCFFLLGSLKERGELILAKASRRMVLATLREQFFRTNYLIVFCLFLVFSGMTNFIPFRLGELDSRVSEFRIGLMYAGYLMGLVSSLLGARIATLLGGEGRAVVAGLALFALSVLGLAAGSLQVLFLVIFVFCGAMFLVHTTASGLVNRYSGDRKGVVNGLYIAFYYGGGAVGSWLPGYVYRYFGWYAHVAFLFAVAVLALVIALGQGGRKDGTVPDVASPGKNDPGGGLLRKKVAAS